MNHDALDPLQFPPRDVRVELNIQQHMYMRLSAVTKLAHKGQQGKIGPRRPLKKSKTVIQSQIKEKQLLKASKCSRLQSSGSLPTELVRGSGATVRTRRAS